MLDGDGAATIELPRYCEALNERPTWIVRGISASMPNLNAKQGVQANTFVAEGGTPHGLIDWQVTGVRHDPYIVAHSIIPEVAKSDTTPVRPGQYLFSRNRPFPLFNWALEFLGRIMKQVDF